MNKRGYIISILIFKSKIQRQEKAVRVRPEPEPGRWCRLEVDLNGSVNGSGATRQKTSERSTTPIESVYTVGHYYFIVELYYHSTRVCYLAAKLNIDVKLQPIYAGEFRE